MPQKPVPPQQPSAFTLVLDCKDIKEPPLSQSEFDRIAEIAARHGYGTSCSNIKGKQTSLIVVDGSQVPEIQQAYSVVTPKFNRNGFPKTNRSGQVEYQHDNRLINDAVETTRFVEQQRAMGLLSEIKNTTGLAITPEYHQMKIPVRVDLSGLRQR